MGIKPHKAFFIVIFFVSGVLVGHYLPIWDTILPSAEGERPTLSEALKDVLGKTGESLKELTTKKDDSNHVKEEPIPIKENVVNKPLNQINPLSFLDSVVTISEIITAQEMKVQNSKKQEIYIILEGVIQKNEELIPILNKYIKGERLWMKPAIQHSVTTKSLLVYAYVIPRSWNKTMGNPILSESLLLNRIINNQIIKSEKR